MTMIELLAIAALALAALSLWLWHRLTLARQQLELEKISADQMKQNFRSLSLEALEKNNQTFLDLAQTSLAQFHQGAKGDLDQKQEAIRHLLQPVKESLGKLDSLKEQVRSLHEAGQGLRKETANLVKALRAPIHRGRWGEIQLRRVVELAGMLNHCDFYEQEQSDGLKPDLLIRLPGGRQVIVDAKVPLDAYLEAIEASDESIREQRMKDHARQVRTRMALLSKKSYWEHFQPTPEFVVLFLPSETLFSAALEHDPSLIESGADERVLLATPTTLIALLKAVAYGWKQESLSRHAEEIQEVGRELYKRLLDMNGHFAKMGRALGSAVESYNKGIGSLESRVMVSARKFKELGATAEIEGESLEMIEKIPRLPLRAEVVAKSEVE